MREEKWGVSEWEGRRGEWGSAVSGPPSEEKQEELQDL